MVHDTSTYHIAYTVAAVIYAGYVASLWWRLRQTERRANQIFRVMQERK